MNRRVARLIVACTAMFTIWESHGMNQWGWIGLTVCLIFVGAGDRVFPHGKVRALFYEIRNIYAEDAKRLKGALK